ncbi:Coenzyme F420 hydrogenase/dehydrogenase, beta subunit C-terminal domain [Desulfosarcina sp.]|uniref:Coenzyme F420 hydrogenase/dehydrogenase, beta subunit C-terminal domain n=1 Tax=Desulfosarcina sp. TaxID=2027861 RepID=UPI0029A89FDB|nr:Coenzyme F420 hydrogenase/dehydrogenase, beta subunit C-terminal domain [Desulfosarcina sp.]MDX2455216.1 Coenzyme F420 hydrogenase/dehydrogenase, beta subunit C-terminal domain [Desulfosarcina sp.]
MNIQDVVNQQYCPGCGLCVADVGREKLTMTESPDGFLVPKTLPGFDGEVPNLASYCPGVTVSLKRPLQRPEEKLYGPFVELKTAYAKDESIRFKGSSGGVLTAILCELLATQKVAGVLQVGAAKEDPTRTESRFSTTVAEVVSQAGSRYAPSCLLADFKTILAEHDSIAVVGKPCDIVGVKQFLDVYPEYKEKVYCTLSFMCMGMPSQNATSRLITRLGVESSEQIKTLAYRGNGWPGEASVVTDDNNRHACTYDESWGKILGRDLLFRCIFCPDGWGSFADISAGDAWHTDGEVPLFDERPGRSLLFARTKLGAAILTDVAQTLVTEDYDIAELPIIQKAQHARKDRAWAAYLVLKIFGDRLLNFRGIGMWSRVFKNSPLHTARMVRGFVKRMPR